MKGVCRACPLAVENTFVPRREKTRSIEKSARLRDNTTLHRNHQPPRHSKARSKEVNERSSRWWDTSKVANDDLELASLPPQVLWSDDHVDLPREQVRLPAEDRKRRQLERNAACDQVRYREPPSDDWLARQGAFSYWPSLVLVLVRRWKGVEGNSRVSNLYGTFDSTTSICSVGTWDSTGNVQNHLFMAGIGDSGLARSSWSAFGRTFWWF